MAKKYKKDDIFKTKELFSEVEWHDNDKDNKRVSFNLLNDNGFIVNLQARNTKKGGGYWYNKVNFYCRMDQMPVLAKVIGRVLRDIEEGNFNNERGYPTKNHSIYFPVRQKDGKLFIGIKVKSSKKGGKEDTFLLPTKEVEGMSVGLIKLEVLKDAISDAYARRNSSYDQHFKEYFEAKKESNGNSNSNSKNNSNSNSNSNSGGSNGGFPY